MTARERDVRMFEMFRMGAVGFFLSGLLLAGINLIGFGLLCGCIIVAATFFTGSLCGQFLVASQYDTGRLSRTRLASVCIVMLSTTCVGTLLYGYTVAPANTTSVEKMVTPDWHDDMNIEPDGMPD